MNIKQCKINHFQKTTDKSMNFKLLAVIYKFHYIEPFTTRDESPCSHLSCFCNNSPLFLQIFFATIFALFLILPLLLQTLVKLRASGCNINLQHIYIMQHPAVASQLFENT